MSWIKVGEKLPDEDQWCWIYFADNLTLCACYDKRNNEWYIPGMDINCSATTPTHWQPYYTPAPPEVFKDMGNWEKVIHDV